MEPEPLRWILHYTLIGQESHAIEALEETLSVRVPSTESEPLRRILHRTLIHQESVLKTVHLSHQDIRHSTFDDRTFELKCMRCETIVNNPACRANLNRHCQFSRVVDSLLVPRAGEVVLNLSCPSHLRHFIGGNEERVKRWMALQDLGARMCSGGESWNNTGDRVVFVAVRCHL